MQLFDQFSFEVPIYNFKGQTEIILFLGRKIILIRKKSVLGKDTFIVIKNIKESQKWSMLKKRNNLLLFFQTHINK
jgi:hypothetical protein